jgi:hypothetical protein
MIRHKSGSRWPNNREVRWLHVRFVSYTWRRWEAQVSWFSLKTGGDGLSVVWPQNHCDSFLIWASKQRSTVWWFGHQNYCDGFLVWISKLRSMVWWFEPQNYRDSFLVWASKLMSEWRRCEDTHWHSAACFVVKQVGLGFSSFASKLVKEWRWVVHIVSSWRSRRNKEKDGWFNDVGCSVVEVRPNYYLVDVIFLLAHKCILVFYFCYKNTHWVIVGGIPLPPSLL